MALATVSATQALAAPCVETPVLFIVQDKSGSMLWAPDGTAPSTAKPSKWQSAKTVVGAMVQRFDNRFDFGLDVYPHNDSPAYSCSPALGGPIATVPTPATGIVNAYAASVPGGNTPTAASLKKVKSYLQSLGGTAVKHVLLITDGMPNCNPSLNPDTCTSTFSNIVCPGTNCGGYGGVICLDDQATASAAAELKAIGVKVWVVGFGAAATGGNNSAVLNAVAAAGGTGTAFEASSEAALAAALETIAASTAQCCKDVCTSGQTRCASTSVRESCQVDQAVGCTGWVQSPCQSLSTCQSGTCVPCANPCTVGALRCQGNLAQQCVAVTGACPSWQTVDTCVSGEVCQSGACASCRDCTLGQARCVGNRIEECKATSVPGCTAWQLRDCAAGSVCVAGACSACNQACTAGAKRCNGKNVDTCTADANGCTAWQQTQACGVNSFCSGGQCGQCGPACTVGSTRCNGNGTELCVTDANGCTTWAPPDPCENNEFCNAAGQCEACATVCAVGSKRCTAGGAVEECRVPAGQVCTEWTGVVQCDLAAGYRCENGACVEPCRDACAEGSAQCASGAPQRCVRQADGCTQWSAEGACAGGRVCHEGVCRAPCADDEFASCASPDRCDRTAGPVGLCLPPSGDGGAGGGGGGGSVDAGSGGGGGGGGADGGATRDAGSGGASAGSAVGCSCSSVDGLSLLAVLALASSALLRRRRPTSA